MSALAQCDAFGFIYDQAGDPAPDVLVVLKRVLDASGNPILLGPKTTLTDSAGSFHFTLPELATAFISARASALWNCPEGRAFTVPPGPSGELVPDFSLPASTLVEPPLVYVGDVLSIPKASATQDGYLSAADYAAFEAGGADVGVTQINTGAGLTGGPITDTGTIGLQVISGVAGTWDNPTSISINAYGQIVAITATADTTAPNITAILATVTGTSVTITWHTDDLSDSQVEYGTTAGLGTPTTIDPTPTQSHSVTITALLASQGYHYVVKSRNTATLLRISPDNTFTTGAVPDTTPPVITLAVPPVTAITDVGATINWTTSESADSQVEYSTDLSYGTPTVPPITNTPVSTSGVTTHAVTLGGLAANTTYNYRVKSKDAAGNPATPVTGTFTTTAGPPVDLLTDLLAYWKLDETVDFRSDSHGSHTLTPGALFGISSGKFNNCPHFVGDSNALRAADGTVAAMGGSVNYTIAAWVQIADKTINRDFISKAGSGAGVDEYIIGYDLAGDRFRFTISGGAYYTVLSDAAGSPAVNTWYLVIAWHDVAGNTLHIQVNNGAVDDFVLTEPPSLGSDLFRMSGYGAITNFWNGLVDEVAIWRGTGSTAGLLTSTQRTSFWGGGAGRPFDTW